jgi:WD40 repeat protein
MKLWDISTGREIRTFSGHTGTVYSISFSPDGKQALSGSGDKTMKLWDIVTGREIRTFSGHKGSVRSVCFNPDGKYALSGAGSGDKTMKLWNITTGQEIKTFSGHTADTGISTVKFSPDGKYALSSTGDIDDGTMRLWDIATGQEIGTFRDEWAFIAMCISPDGNFALSSDGYYKIKLWDLSARPRQQYQSGPSVTNPTVNPPPSVNTWDTPKPAQTQTRCSTCNGSGNCKYCRNGNCNTCGRYRQNQSS